jgi:hypothetical protein
MKFFAKSQFLHLKNSRIPRKIFKNMIVQKPNKSKYEPLNFIFSFVSRVFLGFKRSRISRFPFLSLSLNDFIAYIAHEIISKLPMVIDKKPGKPGHAKAAAMIPASIGITQLIARHAALSWCIQRLKRLLINSGDRCDSVSSEICSLVRDESYISSIILSSICS